MLEKYDISMLDKLNDETYVGYKSACEKTGNNLFLTFSKDIKIQSTFGEPLKMLVNSSSNFERDFSNSSLSFEICSINTNTIIVSPILYDGKLIILHYDSMNCHYNYIDGFQPVKRAYTEYPFSMSKLQSLAKEDVYALAVFTQNGQYLVVRNNISTGLIKYAEKYVLHFINCVDNRNKRSIYLDVFDLNGRLLKTEKLPVEINKKEFKAMFVNNKNELIASTYDEEGLPILKKYKIVIE